MLRVTITNRQNTLPLVNPAIRKAVRAAAEGKWKSGELSIVAVGGEEMTELNLRHTRRVGQTDVLAFCLEEQGMPDDFLGEVIVNAELAQVEAGRRRIKPFEELMLYVIHGVLHIIGYDDHSPADRERMYAEEVRVLRKCGIGDVRNAAPRNLKRRSGK